MKKLSVIVLLVVMFSGSIYAQESIIGDKSVSKKFARNGLSKSIILSRAETWFLNEDNTNKNKVESIDIEKGLLKINGCILKGVRWPKYWRLDLVILWKSM